jgi:hypothetical protein
MYCTPLTFHILLYYLTIFISSVGRDSVDGIVGRSGDQILVGGQIFRTRPDRPWGPPSLLYSGYRVFVM